MTKHFDHVGHWIGEHFDPIWQLRTGVLMIVISIAFFIYMPFSGEQIGIYLMSALAMLFSAPIMISDAVKSIEDSDDHDMEELVG